MQVWAGEQVVAQVPVAGFTQAWPDGQQTVPQGVAPSGQQNPPTVLQTPVVQCPTAAQLPVVGSQHGVSLGQGKAPPAGVQTPQTPLLQTPLEQCPAATQLPVFGSQHGVSPLQDPAVQVPQMPLLQTPLEH